MIVADRKNVAEIRDLIKHHDRVLMVGCGTCVTVCLAGGERETGILGSAVRMALKLDGHPDTVVDECTIERQCEDAFIDALAARVPDYDDGWNLRARVAWVASISSSRGDTMAPDSTTGWPATMV